MCWGEDLPVPRWSPQRAGSLMHPGQCAKAGRQALTPRSCTRPPTPSSGRMRRGAPLPQHPQGRLHWRRGREHDLT